MTLTDRYVVSKYSWHASPQLIQMQLSPHISSYFHFQDSSTINELKFTHPVYHQQLFHFISPESSDHPKKGYQYCNTFPRIICFHRTKISSICHETALDELAHAWLFSHLLELTQFSPMLSVLDNTTVVSSTWSSNEVK